MNNYPLYDELDDLTLGFELHFVPSIAKWLIGKAGRILKAL